jgi:hypothetical protein
MRDKKQILERELARKEKLVCKALNHIPVNQQEEDYRNEFLVTMQSQIDKIKKELGDE